MFADYRRYDALGLADLVRRGETTASELLEGASEHSGRVNRAVNAIVRPMLDQACAAIAAGLRSGPLSDVPFLLKDLNAGYAGVPLTNGSSFFADFVPPEDSTAVRRLRAAGLVIFGKTNTSEFGLHMMTEPRLFGPSRISLGPLANSGRLERRRRGRGRGRGRGGNRACGSCVGRRRIDPDPIGLLRALWAEA